MYGQCDTKSYGCNTDKSCSVWGVCVLIHSLPWALYLSNEMAVSACLTACRLSFSCNKNNVNSKDRV